MKKNSIEKETFLYLEERDLRFYSRGSLSIPVLTFFSGIILGFSFVCIFIFCFAFFLKGGMYLKNKIYSKKLKYQREYLDSLVPVEAKSFLRERKTFSHMKIVS